VVSAVHAILGLQDRIGGDDLAITSFARTASAEPGRTRVGRYRMRAPVGCWDGVAVMMRRMPDR
jgi:hypothetical protein